MKASTLYEVRVDYVDSTYWDDGSRWTHSTFRFNGRKEAIEFAREVSTKGCKVKGQNGDLLLHPCQAEISVERTTKSRVNWKAPE